MGYSRWGQKELDMTEHSTAHTYTYTRVKNPNSIEEKKMKDFFLYFLTFKSYLLEIITIISIYSF